MKPFFGYNNRFPIQNLASEIKSNPVFKMDSSYINIGYCHSSTMYCLEITKIPEG